ncbi:MAG: PhoH family protein [Spirochaetes bacterium]|nr:PhoH family protein [Spirochaetota bacterium]
MQKTFILDTNVLIHDPESIFAFGDNKVVIPMTVIEELDKVKQFRDNVGYNTRQVTRKIDELRKQGSLYDGVPINEGGIFKVIRINGQGEWPEGLDRNKKDNVIIQTAYNLLKTEKKVIFISKDLNARIKSDVLGIETMDYEKQKVKIVDFTRGWEEILVKSKVVDKFYKDKKISVSEIDSKEQESVFYPNCFVLLRDVADKNKTGIGKYDHIKKEILPLKHFKQDVWGIKALNLEQKFLFDLLLDPKISLVTIIGQAGTGKTLLALAAGLKQTLDDGLYKKILVSRPIMPLGKDIGYLPGTKDEKLSVWMQPIFDNLYFILNQTKGGVHLDGEEIRSKKRGAGGIVDYFIDTEVIEMAAVTYIRGRSIPEQYIIIDEAQNLTPHEVKTIISRVGNNTKIVLTGDPYQIDNPYLDAESNGLIYVAERFKGNELAGHIILSKSERSPLAALAADLL